MADWPHAPMHRLIEKGTYIVTGGTYLKAHRLEESCKRDLVQDCLFELAAHYGWLLQAWSILINHYHFVAMSPKDPANLKSFLSRFHMQTAKAINAADGCPGCRVWYQYFETLITYQESNFARLRYVHENPVHHGVVRTATAYPWCSAGWFERTASRAFQGTVASFKIDRVKVYDDF
jgi:putative transposase